MMVSHQTARETRTELIRFAQGTLRSVAPPPPLLPPPSPCCRHLLHLLSARFASPAGIMAPGLTALAAAIRADGFCSFTVSAPAGERSAQSHCITIGKHLHAWELPVEGAEEAWAVDGTPGGSAVVEARWLAGCGAHGAFRMAAPVPSRTAPTLHAQPCAQPGSPPSAAADSTMLALYGPLLRNRSFNLVVSGINRCVTAVLAVDGRRNGGRWPLARQPPSVFLLPTLVPFLPMSPPKSGDNCGLHIIYSGTVGAAREAACKARWKQLGAEQLACCGVGMPSRRAGKGWQASCSSAFSRLAMCAVTLAGCAGAGSLPGQLRGAQRGAVCNGGGLHSRNDEGGAGEDLEQKPAFERDAAVPLRACWLTLHCSPKAAPPRQLAAQRMQPRLSPHNHRVCCPRRASCQPALAWPLG